MAEPSLFFSFSWSCVLYAAVGLAEEMLAVAEETLSLKDVHNFQKLVKSLTSRQLAFFCRVLAMVVFEPEVSGGHCWCQNTACLGTSAHPVVPPPRGPVFLLLLDLDWAGSRRHLPPRS